jgi:tetratricopeptide (TPR) repeat protein
LDRDLTGPERKKKLEDLKVSEFWFNKGALSQLNLSFITAIDCYKQAVIFNEKNFPSMYNLAICFERLGKFGSSLTWFSHAFKVMPTFDEAYMGSSLVLIKTGEYAEALKFADIAVQTLNTRREQRIPNEPAFEKMFNRSQSKSLRSRFYDY